MASNASIPPYDNMFLIGIWIQTALYGINMMIFAAAILVLTKMYRAGKSSAGFLLVTSILLFSLSTAYVILSQSQNWPYMKSMFLDKMQFWKAYLQNTCTKSNLMIFTDLAHIVMELAHIASGIFTIRRGALPHISVFDLFVHRGAIANWTLDLAVNIGVTLCIAYRLWSAGRALENLGMKRNKHPYMGVIFTIVESGGIFATATLITVSLYLSGNVASVAAIDSVVQLATITPLLIVVRVGFVQGEMTSRRIRRMF
ncbi:protein [Lentinula edodes]|uniref:Protein n=1 Tax=Lentinula edodes TaxID=5353 RepID=A0A1Q3EHG1_LENED|nr:protein [Lentinula edodes]